MASSEAEPPQCRITFITLPLEIKRNIYAHYFHPQGGVYKPYERARALNFCHYETERSLRKPNALLRTCRSVHAEATPILYGQHTFLFKDHRGSCPVNYKDLPSMARMTGWLEQIGKTNASMIRHLQLVFQSQHAMLEASILYAKGNKMYQLCCAHRGLQHAIARFQEFRSLWTLRVSFEDPSTSNPESLSRRTLRGMKVSNSFMALFKFHRGLPDIICSLRGLHEFHVDCDTEALYSHYYNKDALEKALNGVEEVRRMICSPRDEVGQAYKSEDARGLGRNAVQTHNGESARHRGVTRCF